MLLPRYLQSPKNFRRIAEFLPNKTVNDVINYYYVNKRKLNLKKLVREQGRQRHRPSVERVPVPPPSPRPKVTEEPCSLTCR